MRLLTKFHQNIWSGCQENARKPFKKALKIGRFRVKFSHWRRGVGKNLMTHYWKEIYRRFWKSNQIFRSIYGSGDIGRSLDTTLPVFSQNWHFVDEYLENGANFGHAVFAGCSVLISSTFWSVLSKFNQAVFEKKSKNRHFDHIFALYGWSRFFLQNRASSLFTPYRCLTSCKKSKRSYDRLLRKSADRWTDGRTNMGQSIGPTSYVGGSKK